MSLVIPHQWIDEQRGQGRDVCLVLDAQHEIEARTALLSERAHDRYCSVYSQTPVAELAAAGPFLIVLDSADIARMTELLRAPERNWGWLASIAPGDLPVWLAHWRARCLVGVSSNRALYRFQDNRVLTRALGHLPVGTLPAYLGSAISVCYWQGDQWASVDNPMPGEYPLPIVASWLNVPATNSQRAAICEANALRFLMEHHQQACLHVVKQLPLLEWIRLQCKQADDWGWGRAEQLEFLLTHSLKFPGYELPVQWHPHPEENAAEHFQRVNHIAILCSAQGAV